jgi:hypothetical protein
MQPADESALKETSDSAQAEQSPQLMRGLLGRPNEGGAQRGYLPTSILRAVEERGALEFFNAPVDSESPNRAGMHRT